MTSQVVYEVHEEAQMWRVYRQGEFFWQRPNTTGSEADAVASGAGRHEAELPPFPAVDVKRSDGSVQRFGPDT
jgi:hypothetical protein